MTNFCHSCKFYTLTINFSEVWPTKIFGLHLRNVLNTPQRHLENMLTRTLSFDDTSRKGLEDIFVRRLEDVLKTSSKLLEDVMEAFFQDVLKTSWRRFEDVFARHLRRLEDVLKTYDQGEYVGLDQDFLKTSWRRLLKTYE